MGGEDSIYGGGGSDDLAGGAASDLMRGASGNDLLNGNSGNDDLGGGGGNDTLIGSGGRDRLAGDAGADVLLGGTLADVLVGGTGADRFLFTDVSHSGFDPSRRDLIDGFARGFDTIDLDPIDAKASTGAEDDFTFRGTNSFNGEGQVRLGERDGKTVVLVNTEGRSGAEMAITLDRIYRLTADDFDL